MQPATGNLQRAQFAIWNAAANYTHCAFGQRSALAPTPQSQARASARSSPTASPSPSCRLCPTQDMWIRACRLLSNSWRPPNLCTLCGLSQSHLCTSGITQKDISPGSCNCKRREDIIIRKRLPPSASTFASLFPSLMHPHSDCACPASGCSGFVWCIGWTNYDQFRLDLEKRTSLHIKLKKRLCYKKSKYG